MFTNTTRLIGEWSMDGDHGVRVDGFRPLVDIHAIVSARRDEPGDEVAPPTRPPLLLKPAGEDDWLPLLVGDPA